MKNNHRTKTITFNLQIPVRFKWTAVQPWGTVMLFTRKPKVVKDGDAYYWDMQDSEQILCDVMEREPNYTATKLWRNTLRRL